MKTKISEEQEVDRDIKVYRKGKDFVIEDAYKNTLTKKEPMDYMNYFDSLFHNNSNLLSEIEKRMSEIKNFEIAIKQNEELMEALRPFYKKAKLEHKKNVLRQQRQTKQDGTA